MTENKIYIINGKQYNSLDEVPLEFRDRLNQETMDIRVNDAASGTSKVIIAPISGKNAQTRLFLAKSFVYILSQSTSLAENIAMLNLSPFLGLTNINSFLSLFVGLIIGHISYALAVRKYEASQKNTQIEFSYDLSFLKDFLLVQLSGIYAVVMNLAFYALLFVYKSIAS